MVRLLSCVIGGFLVLPLGAGTSSIGVVKSPGEFRVDGATVRGNSTVFEGNVIESGAARSVVQLAGGQVTLLPQSRVRVFRDRAVLERGGSLLRGTHQGMEASAIRVIPSDANALVQVELGAQGSVTVAGQSGAAEVRGKGNVLLASLNSGTAFNFAPQAGSASGQVKVTGVLEMVDGHYFLTDATTKAKLELQGSDLAKYIGKTVMVGGAQIPGSTPSGGASQVVQVATIDVVNERRPAGGAVTQGNSGLSNGARYAIIGGVAVGGAVAGLAAAGVFSGTTVSQP
jgi:hypothetical protein